jgi:hypothetical protein
LVATVRSSEKSANTTWVVILQRLSQIAAKYTTSKATSTFFAKIAKGEDDGAKEMALLAHSEREEEGFVSYDDPGASADTSMTDIGSMLDFTKHSNSNN